MFCTPGQSPYLGGKKHLVHCSADNFLSMFLCLEQNRYSVPQGSHPIWGKTFRSLQYREFSPRLLPPEVKTDTLHPGDSHPIWGIKTKLHILYM